MKSFITSDVRLEAKAIMTRGTMPVRVIPGTSSSATFTTMRLITNEKAPNVMRRIGKEMILRIVPRMRFTSPRMTAKMRAEVYPFWRTIHSI